MNKVCWRFDIIWLMSFYFLIKRKQTKLQHLNGHYIALSTRKKIIAMHANAHNQASSETCIVIEGMVGNKV